MNLFGLFKRKAKVFFVEKHDLKKIEITIGHPTEEIIPSVSEAFQEEIMKHVRANISNMVKKTQTKDWTSYKLKFWISPDRIRL